MSIKYMVLFFVLSCLSFVSAQQRGDFYKVCASPGKIAECQALDKGNSQVTCVTAIDSVDCLLKMDQDLADFVILTAEETILTAIAQPEKYNVLASVRHEDKRYEQYAFQAVAVVRASHVGGLSGLSGGGLCHPGYGKAKEQLWSDRVLKYFEKKVVSATKECVKDSKSSAEDDAHDLSRFFSAACRPGPWLLNPDEDKKLKSKFPSLCSLCTSDGTPDCDGYRYFEPRAVSGVAANSHLSAMECLASNRGSVAYIAYNHFREYLKNNAEGKKDYALLCENGTTIALANATLGSIAPCTWIRQPWSALISRSSLAEKLLGDLRTWMPGGRAIAANNWVDSLDAIIFKEKSDVLEYMPNARVKPADYITQSRPLPVAETNPCHKTLRWCTVNETEHLKCTWVQRAALTVGLRPDIFCVPGTSHIDCLSQIKAKRADFIGIDSNIGYLARKYYEQTTVLYGETSRTLTSRVLALVKEESNSGIQRFENLKKKNACFPEYGGIAWTAFIRTARERKVFSESECDYANEVVNFFSASCAPGARDPAHFPSKAADPAKLCTGCRGFTPRNGGANEQGIVTLPAPVPVEQECPADSTNKFYGTTGALNCLIQPDSDVAFIEGQYLAEKAKTLNLRPEQFRVLCKNGSLASMTGFEVDENCALSVTIDNEVVARRDYDDVLSLQLFLQELETWFGYITGTVSLINMQVFSPFNGTKNLLFKDSTIGLVPKSSDNEFVKNYINLFQHVDTCTSSAVMHVMPIFMSFVMVLIVKILAY